MSEMKMKYGDGEIRYCERLDNWEIVMEGNVVGTRQSLAEAKKFADKYGEEEKIFARHTALLKKYNEPWQTVTVTSYPDSTWQGPVAWVTRVEGSRKRREQIRLGELYEDVPANHVLISQIKALDEEIAALNKKKDSLEHKMVSYKKRNV